MKSIIAFIFNVYKKYKLKNFLVQIDQYLLEVSNKKDEIGACLQSLSNQRDYITDEQLEAVKNVYLPEASYFSLDNPFNINKKAHSFYEKEEGWIISNPSYKKVMTRYNQTKDAFLSQLVYLDEAVVQINDHISQNNRLIEQFISHVVSIKKEYITHSITNKILTDYSNPYTFFSSGRQSEVDKVAVFLETYTNFHSLVSRWNKEYVQRELEENKELFDNIDGKSLDAQQRLSIVTDEDHNLILAGAGSGKTLTISGKVKYLIDKKQIRPEQILLISFTKKASEEMYDRISKKLNVDVQVKTFHKLGLEIIKRHEKKNPSIAEESELEKAINSYIQSELLHDKNQIKRLIEFFSYYLNIPKDYTDFKSLGEYHEHCKSIDKQTIRGKTEEAIFVKKATGARKEEMRSLKGERVKSLEEVMIANFLFLNGVDYIYEADYKHETRDRDYRQYKPDFYLPEFDIYIEHFGLTEHQRAPWLNRYEEEKYIEGVAWKRKLHTEKGTTLIESYSYYNKNGILLEMLRENLKKHNVEMYEIDFQEIFSIIFDQDKQDQYFREFFNLIKTFIGLFKSNGFTEKEFDEFIEINKQKENNEFLKERTDLFFHFVKPIYLHYQADLSKKKMIDFNDMINQATNIVCSDDVYFGYRYIIIDEYQDVSISRFNLIKAIKEKTSAKVLCVGDDWQSIYRFAGSDIQLFTQFGKFFGEHELLRIEKTYRNSQELINTAGDFVMKNPMQFKKDLTSPKNHTEPIKVIGFNNQIHEALKFAIEEIVSSYGEETEIMLLGRNRFDIKPVLEEPDFKGKWNKKTGICPVKYNKYPSLKMVFLTAHKSKGLEADNVILLNGKNDINGFPNKMVDDPILSWVLTDSDSYLYGEERRLFYVAVTRTKNITYVLAPEGKMSTFTKELIESYDAPYISLSKGKSILDNPRCPKCQTGYLQLREAKKKFVGCANYPSCDYTLNQIGVLENPKKCSSCGGFMVRKTGKYGDFLGCTNYSKDNHPSCANTMDIS
ncbi:UvrD-helicase domain-containing protein [Thermoactinomyces sp. DSM 45892]|uniref:UvrD-helicase domain-containing protein n=1 Tax=Thermoactinomyces sp. DSM 45892 TaxID=1882753 RepID=UPI0008946A40|nr:UvrD-helicase domain-containing protein [Thermoactinomyces sp. DSM 45892]SDX96470.1 DNA helicase-4 [Thermoactinomyces sp. DSM 45892]